jgi:hypothetical protein
MKGNEFVVVCISLYCSSLFGFLFGVIFGLFHTEYDFIRLNVIGFGWLFYPSGLILWSLVAYKLKDRK